MNESEMAEEKRKQKNANCKMYGRGNNNEQFKSEHFASYQNSKRFDFSLLIQANFLKWD